MKKLFVLSTMVVLVLAISGLAVAADNASTANNSTAVAPAAKAPEAKAPEAKAPEGVKATVKGKVSSKTVNRKGKDVKMFEITVTEAKGADGKAMDDLKGKALRLGPHDKAAEFEKFDGKDAEATGSVAEGRRAGTKILRVESIK